MTTIYLIRHAQADGNVYRRIHGQYDGFVTPHGYREIVCLANRFKDTKFDAVYSSDLYRTRETARAISEFNNLTINLSPALREISLSEWEDLPWGEVIVNRPEEYEIWEDTPYLFKLNGGESYNDIYARAKLELDRIAKENNGKTVAVFSHGTVIRSVLAMLKYSDMSKVNEIGWCDNTAVSKFTVDENLNYTIEFINDSSHLNCLENSDLLNRHWWDDSIPQNMRNLHYVPAEFPADLDKADEYYRNAWEIVYSADSYDSKTTRKALNRASKTHPGAVVFACQGNDSQDIGLVVLDTRAKLLPGAGHIMLLCLKPEFCGKDFGAQLLGHAISIYRSVGRKWITVRVASTNTRALNFYNKFGFERFSAEDDNGSLQLILRKRIDGAPADITWK